MARRLAGRMVANPEVARELVQEALLQAYLSLARLRETERFKSWFYGIVLNVCRSYLRSHKTAVLSLESLAGGLHFEKLSFETLVSAAAQIPDPHEVAEEQELQRAVLQAVKMLSPENRAATLLFYYEQLSLQEIAALLGISVTAVKGRLYKARKQLKGHILPLYPEIAQPEQRSKKTMTKVTIVDVVRKEIHGRALFAIILADEAGKRALPVWVARFEGEQIAAGLGEMPYIRPLTYNFMAALLEATGATLEEVRIETLKDDTFYGIAKVRNGNRVQEVDARPSDALALALRTSSPIYVAEELLEKAGTDIPEAGAAIGQGMENIRQTMREEFQMQERLRSAYDKEEAKQGLKNLMAQVFGGQSQ